MILWVSMADFRHQKQLQKSGARRWDAIIVKTNGFGVRWFWIGALILPPTSCVISGNYPNSVSSSFLIGKVGA